MFEFIFPLFFLGPSFMGKRRRRLLLSSVMRWGALLGETNCPGRGSWTAGRIKKEDGFGFIPRKDLFPLFLSHTFGMEREKGRKGQFQVGESKSSFFGVFFVPSQPRT